MYQLRDYQQQCVQAVLAYFRKNTAPALVVLPTGAGKSLVIAELARLARGRVLVLAHVKELVEQNQQKYQQYGLEAGIYAAGLGLKQTNQQVVFASIQSVSRNLDDFAGQFSLLVIDECHRVPDHADSSYRQVAAQLQRQNPALKILGLTATPFRLGSGFIYQYHQRGQLCNEQPQFFHWCIFELSIRHLLTKGYLTPPRVIDAPVLGYDFSGLTPASNGQYRTADLDLVIDKAKRVTPQIVRQVLQYAESAKGVMIFAATAQHAREVLGYLPEGQAALILAITPAKERLLLIEAFKAQQLKYLVNVSVLTTGFDAPHVDLIAILRPTESVSLYQQMVGRGLRLAPGKTECLVLDYAGNMYDLYSPQIGAPPADSTATAVTVVCPACAFANQFWGKADAKGVVLEHYGRRCQGLSLDAQQQVVLCGYRFKAKFCPQCGAEHDIAARLCAPCGTVLVDPDKKLQDALLLKDALVIYPQQMQLSALTDANGKPRIKVSYQDADQQVIHEFWPFATKGQRQQFAKLFVPPHLVDRHLPFSANTIAQLMAQSHRLQPPAAVIARKEGRFWRLREKLFELTTKV